ncbi:MAG: S-layer homology domain-containing protein [Ruminiclostridium sp.]|nr:S-layer homology domain-containing protein [Ruminiclostridium sp.]
MRNLKKVLTLVLTVAMLLSVMVVGTGAAFSDQSTIKNTEAVDACVALNIIGGFPDGTYRPTNNVTRAEMCKMICIALNGGKEPNLGTNNTPTFSDVRGTSGAWAEAYIESCNSQGIVSGVGGGRFSPNGNITGTQAARMLLVTLGYNATTEQFTGDSWAVNVNIRATQKGLYKGIEGIDTNAALTRDSAAQMIKNALDAKMVTYKNEFSTGPNGQIIATPVLADKLSANGSSVTLLGDKYEAITVKDQLTEFDYNSNKGEWSYTIGGDATNDKGEVVEYAPVVTSTKDYTEMLGQNVQAVYTYDNVKKQNILYGIFADDSKVVTTALIGDLPKLTDASATSFKISGETYKLENTLDSVPVYQFTGNAWNTQAYTSADLDTDNVTSLFELAGQKTVNAQTVNITAYDAQKFTAIDLDGNGKIDFFTITPYTVAKINYVSSDKFRLAGSSTDYNFSDVNAYEGLAKGDFVIFTAGYNTADETDSFVMIDKMSGEVSKVDDTRIMIQDTWYTLDNSYGSITGGAAQAKVTTAAAKLTDAIIVNGYVFYVDKADSTSVDDYAVVIATEGGGVSGSQAKLLFANGDKTVVSTAKDYSTGSDAIAAGTLVTYSKNSDNEYILNKNIPTTAAAAGFDMCKQATGSDYVTITKSSNSSDKAGYINGAYVDDDAVIFIKYKGSSYKVVTGEQLKKMDVADFDGTFANGYVLGTKSGGSYHVDMAFISTTGIDINDADTYYGYVTAVSDIQNADKEKVKSVTVWTADGEKTFETAASSTAGANTIAKRNVIEYKLNAEGEISQVLNSWDVDGTTAIAKSASGNEAVATVAITALSPTLQVQLDQATSAISNLNTNNVGYNNSKNYMDLDSDTVYLYIENSEAKGMDKVDISTADDNANVTDARIPNAFIVVDKDGDIALLVYDVDNEIAE